MKNHTIYIGVSTARSNLKHNHTMVYSRGYVYVSKDGKNCFFKDLPYIEARRLQAKLFKKYGKKLQLQNTIINQYEPTMCYKETQLWIEYD